MKYLSLAEQFALSHYFEFEYDDDLNLTFDELLKDFAVCDEHFCEHGAGEYLTIKEVYEGCSMGGIIAQIKCLVKDMEIITDNETGKQKFDRFTKIINENDFKKTVSFAVVDLTKID